MKIKNLKVTKRMTGLALIGTLCLTGCSESEGYVVRKDNDYDILDTNSTADNENSVNDNSAEDIEAKDVETEDIETVNENLSGVRQELDVNGEVFKLIIEYSCNDDWRITSDKELHMLIYTEGLPANKEVYIDTIHMDTSIVSNYDYYNGILQDTLDDHIHNSLLYGFPISDDNSYYGSNKIEGQNDNFISGFVRGYNGYHSGSISEKRFLEEDYLAQGVWANKISGVVGLIIMDVETGKTRGVDVDTDLFVTVNNTVVYYRNGKYETYEYDRNGKKHLISSTEEKPKSLTKKKN